ncbi:MAG TPA: hypothetical protein PK264_23895, partial [Hyphomicrobiaceae bacterium]|nr:hypothetical protein [Hyphomicrobiaceae bacterium]
GFIAGNLAERPSELAAPGELRRSAAFTYRAAPAAPDRLAAGVVLPMPDGGSLIVGQDLEDYRALLSRLHVLLLAGLGAIALLGLGAGHLVSQL